MPSSEKFIITGRKKLHGTIEVRGAKNAAFPIMMATLLTREECVIDNIPLIDDVFVILKLLESIGVRYHFVSKRKIVISARNILYHDIPHDLIKKTRASLLLWGALSARIPSFTMRQPGGCSIGSRIFKPHIDALAPLGVIVEKQGSVFMISKKKCGTLSREIVLSEMSVTATENVILAAVLSPGITHVYCAALEPHVQDLCHMLCAMGADIAGIETHTLHIRGVKKLKGVHHWIIPDPIEMGTFITLAAATKSHLVIRNSVPAFIRFDLLKFQEAHVTLRIRPGKKKGWGYTVSDIEVIPSPLKAIRKLHNLPYPGLCPDILPLFTILATQARGTTFTHDWMYEGRLTYIRELKRMGAQITLSDQHRAYITGPTPLQGKEIHCFDLRAGATLLIAALIAKGKSVIHDIYRIDRGYERIEDRLQAVGASIKRVL